MCMIDKARSTNSLIQYISISIIIKFPNKKNIYVHCVIFDKIRYIIEFDDNHKSSQLLLFNILAKKRYLDRQIL